MPTVLFIDEDEVFREQLRALFDYGSGFDVFVEALNGVEALKKTKRLLPSLVVLGFSLPDMSGLELAEKLNTIMPELPIFVLTTGYSLKVEKIALSYGVTAVFSKLDDLATLVANARAVCGIE
jgi:DNA-binding NarL/FixJ family response regulator